MMTVGETGEIAMTMVRILRSIGYPVTSLAYPDGSRLLLLPHGARVLGLYTASDDQNFFWTNPALEAAKTARAFLKSDNWHNSGGDRTWISPEIDIFFPNFPKLEVYRVPPQLDPGHYEPVGRNAVSYSGSCTLSLGRSRQTIRLKILKSWGSAPNPLRYEAKWKSLKSVQYAGYTQRTTLRLVRGSDQQAATGGIWNLLQLPPGGDFLAPTHTRTQPTVYFGTIPRGDLVTQQHAVRYTMSAQGVQKIGIPASAATGRAGYLYQQGGRWALVVRNFFVDPSGEYVDVPWNRDGQVGDRGIAIQACNVHCDLGRFAEMEYHAPALGGYTGVTCREDVSQVWAFRGPRKLIQMIAHLLVSSPA